MNRFTSFLRLAVIVLVAAACGFLSTLVPSPYAEFSSVPPDRVQETSGSDTFHETIHSGTSDFQGVDVDMIRLTSFSGTS